MKKLLAFILALAMVFALAACSTEEDAAGNGDGEKTVETDVTPAGDEKQEETPKEDEKQEEPKDEEPKEEEKPAEETPDEQPDDTPMPSGKTTVRVGSLKGPTTMGIVNLMKKAENGETDVAYEFTMATQADEIAAGIVGGTLDIALVPANLASVLYNKTSGGVAVIDINTLGVLYCVTGDDSITSVEDLAGKTVVLTGQGTTPEYSLRYLIEQYGVTDCTLEFKSEATEVAAVLTADSNAIAVLPQPFATVAQVQNEALHEAFYLSDEWDAISGGSTIVTGVTIVRAEFLENNPDAVTAFLNDHYDSADLAKTDVDGTAELIAEYGIIEKAPIAKRALPKCGITAISGSQMRDLLEGYLTVLWNADNSSVGGWLPADDFYYGA